MILLRILLPIDDRIQHFNHHLIENSCCLTKYDGITLIRTSIPRNFIILHSSGTSTWKPAGTPRSSHMSSLHCPCSSGTRKAILPKLSESDNPSEANKAELNRNVAALVDSGPHGLESELKIFSCQIISLIMRCRYI